jgi:capsular exopolysaccharide synthesis family protein
MLKHEVDADRDLYQGLLGKLKQAGVLAGLHSSNIVVVDPARPAYRPASPHYVLNLLLGLAIGLLGGVGCAFIQDGTDHTIRTPADVEKLTGLRALGVIPNINDHPSTEQDERFRALRTRLLSSHPSHPASVFLITSALPSEGKTTVSIYLSKSLAQLGRRVLLVDADLRRPSVHRDLHLQSGDHGLSNALAGTATPAIQRLPSGLDVLPAGCAGSLPELLGSKSMTDMITAWRSQYDYIVFDTPPALAFSDASLLADSVDAVAVVTRAGFTHSDALLRAMEIFESCRAPLLGAVVNRLNFRSPEYAHYFGHSYRPHPPKERES